MHVPYRDDDELAQVAEAFLAAHRPSHPIPIPIEVIVDVGMGIHVVPEPGLEAQFGIGAFLSRDLSEIRVDERIYERNENRYRFSLAHEVAHILLNHQEILSDAFESDGLIRSYQDLPSPVYKRIEFQASRVAGHLLVPVNSLRNEFRGLMAQFESEDVSQQEKVDAAEVILAKTFKVARLTLHIQLEQAGLIQR